MSIGQEKMSLSETGSIKTADFRQQPIPAQQSLPQLTNPDNHGNELSVSTPSLPKAQPTQAPNSQQERKGPQRRINITSMGQSQQTIEKKKRDSVTSIDRSQSEVEKQRRISTTSVAQSQSMDKPRRTSIASQGQPQQMDKHRRNSSVVSINQKLQQLQQPDLGRRSSTASIGQKKFSLSARGPTVRRMSRLELVEGPTGTPTLVQVEEEDDHETTGSRRDSQGTVVTGIGAIPAQLDKQLIDSEIKTQVAHHSPAIEDSSSAANSHTTKGRGRLPRDSVTSFLLQHLHAALASPVLFRIPYLVQKHSSKTGSAFLMVYCILLFVVGAPLYVLEVVMAQYASLGPIYIYRCLPLFTGVGVSMLVACFFLMSYSSVIVTWSSIYILQSFYNPLPWQECPSGSAPECTNITNPTISDPTLNLTAGVRGDNNVIRLNYIPSEYFFLTQVTRNLQVQETLVETEMMFDVELTLLLFGLWFVVFMCLTNRRNWNTGVVSFTLGLIMLLMLFSLFVIGLGQDQGDRGIHRAFVVNFTYVVDDIKDPTIWLDALGQIFWSLGAGIGLLIMSASHNRFTDSVSLNVSAALLCNLGITILMVLAVFPFVGQLFLSPDVAVNPGFFFVISSYAVTNTSLPQLASVVLYSCFSLLLLNHIVTLADTVLGSLAEVLQIEWRRGFRRIALGALISSMAFATSIFFASSDGIYLMTALDSYLPWVSGALLALLETVAFAVLYGAANVVFHLHKMNQTKTNYCRYWQFVLIPVLLGLQLWGWIVGVRSPIGWVHGDDTDEDTLEDIGLVLSVLPVAAILIGTLAVFYFYRKRGSLMMPLPSWGPALLQHRKLYTSDVLRATQRVPWLVMQSQGDLVSESSQANWVPTGYAFLPEDTSYVLLSSVTKSVMDDAARMTVIRNFKRRYSPDNRCSVDPYKSRCPKCVEAQKSAIAGFPRQRKPRLVPQDRPNLEQVIIHQQPTLMVTEPDGLTIEPAQSVTEYCQRYVDGNCNVEVAEGSEIVLQPRRLKELLHNDTVLEEGSVTEE